MNHQSVGLLVLLCLFPKLYAQSGRYPSHPDSAKVRTLDEVVVSDSRFALKREHSGKTVIKIDSLELQRYQGQSVAEIINTKGGIEIAGSRGREGAVLGVFARGGRGRQVLVLIDGVRVTDPSSSSREYDLRMLNTSNIASIEIIKGASSTLYGANAATAVIQITTKKGSSKPLALLVETSRGTHQTAEDQNYDLGHAYNHVSLSGQRAGFHYKASFSNRYADGVSALDTAEDREDRYSQFGTDVRLGYDFSQSLGFSLYANQTKLKSEYDESFGFFDAPYRFDSQQERIGLTAHWQFGRGSLHLNTAYSEYVSENISAFPGTFRGDNRTMDLYAKYVVRERWHFLLGLNYLRDRADFGDGASFTLTDPYANMVYISDFGLNLNMGARLNRHSAYGTHWVYSLNPSYTLVSGRGYFKPFASYATSYITPSLDQLFGAFGPNPELEPEENRTLELGLEYSPLPDLRMHVLYFDRKEVNAVGFVNNQYANLASEIRAKGLEYELKWSPGKSWNLSANYTFTERQGDNAIRIPTHKGNLVLGYAFSPNTEVMVSYSYTGKRLDQDFSVFDRTVLVPLDAFSLIDMRWSHELLPDRLSVFLSLENLFNADYVEILGFTTLGRNAKAGMRLRF